MKIGAKIRQRRGKLFGLLLLILFLGYYGGITLFPHSHIVNGITIIHSHPFKSGKDDPASSFPHSDKELVVIQLLSVFISTALAFSFILSVLRSFLKHLILIFTTEGYAEPGGNRNNSLRAPPTRMAVLIFR